MGKPKQPKTKEDKLKEGLNLLKQLRDGGVRDSSLGYNELKTRISEWVSTEECQWEGTIDFREYGRVAEVELPRYDNRPAAINFKVKRQF